MPWLSENTEELDFKQTSMVILPKTPTDQVLYIMVKEFLPPLRMRIMALFALSLQHC